MAEENVTPEEGKSEEESFSKEQVEELISKRIGREREKFTELRESFDKEKEARIRLEERTAPVKEETLTRTQLREGVEAGRFTQDQVDDYKEQQLRKEITAEVTQTIEATMQESRTGDMIERGLRAYADKIPDILDKESEEFRKVRREFNALVEIGQPNSPQTEVLACRQLYGPADSLKELTRERIQTHSEVGGVSGTGGSNSKKPTGIKLSKEHEAFYQKNIDRNVYKGWDDPDLKAELKILERRAAS